MLLWVLITIFAAFMQTIRTAYQKDLKSVLSNDAITWLRYGIGFPFAVLYFSLFLGLGYEIPDINQRFIIYCILGGAAQIAATYILVWLFSFRNFSVATMYAKTEGAIAAILGVLFFEKYIPILGWVGIFISVIGVFLISLRRETKGLLAILKDFTHKTSLIGLFSGLCFALAVLFFREANLSLTEGSFFVKAAMTLSVSTVIQAFAMTIWIGYKQKDSFKVAWDHKKKSLLVGFTSILGSIGWVTALALADAGYVKTVGQVELLFSLAMTHYYFKEKMTFFEILGMIFMIFGIVMLVYFS